MSPLRFITGACLAALVLVGTPYTASAAPSADKTAESLTTFPTSWCKLDDKSSVLDLSISFHRPVGRFSGDRTMHITPVYVDFSDAPGIVAPQAQFDTYFPGASHAIEVLTQGHVTVQSSAPTTWLRMSKPSTAYTISSFAAHAEFMTEAVRLADDSVDFSGTDFVLVVTPGQAAGPSTASFLPDPFYGITVDGTVISNGLSLTMEGAMTDGPTLMWGIFKAFGLPSLRGGVPYAWAAPYSFNSAIGGPDDNLFAWEDWIAGWLDDAQAVCLAAGTSSFDLADLTATGRRLAAIPLNGGRMLVLESRPPSEREAGGHMGVLPYVVNPRVSSDAGPIRLATDTQGIPVQPLQPGQSITVEGNRIDVVTRNETSYAVQVTAVSPTKTVPGSVTGLKATSRKGTVKVTWQEPTKTGWTPITGYEYRVMGMKWLKAPVGGLLIPGMKRGTSTTIQVRARNAVGAGRVSMVKVLVR